MAGKLRVRLSRLALMLLIVALHVASLTAGTAEDRFLTCMRGQTGNPKATILEYYTPTDTFFQVLQDRLYQDRRVNYHKPLIIVLPRTSNDVSRSVACGNAANLTYTIRNGGHNYEAMSAGHGGIVLDLSGMTELSVKLERSTTATTVRVGAGWLLGPLYLELTRRNIVLPGGTCPGVGVSGVTLGGGLGYATRALGMTSDKVSSATVITADGDTVTASSSSNSDLFFALRGGGGNYGIVTSWTFTLPVAPKGPVTWLRYSWPYTRASEAAGHNAAVMAAWNAWKPWQLPKEFSLVEMLIGEGRTEVDHGNRTYLSGNGWLPRADALAGKEQFTAHLPHTCNINIRCIGHLSLIWWLLCFRNSRVSAQGYSHNPSISAA